MNSEWDTIKHFIKYLKEHGYPEDSIITEYPIGSADQMIRIDIAILDKKQNIFIQLFELKLTKEKYSIERGIAQLRTYRSILKDENIPSFLVFPKETSPYFEIIDIDSKKIAESIEYVRTDGEEYIELNYVPQRNMRVYTYTQRAKQEKDDAIGRFKWMCLIFSAIMLLLGVLTSIIDCFKIRSAGLALIGFSVVLFLVPYASKIKWLGFEYERLRNDGADDKRS